VIDIATEQLQLLSKAPAHIPGRPHPSTIFRWCMRGSKGIKLETVVVGGRRFTSLEAIERFICRLNSPGEVSGPARNQKTSEELELVNRRLDAEGIAITE
jgi:hypothetical protein